MKSTEDLEIYIKENQEKLYRFACGYINNNDMAIEALQNAIIKAMVGYSKIRHKQYLNTWFHRILINECKNLLRKKSNYLSFEENEYLESPFVDATLHLAMQDVLNKIEWKYREIIYLKHYQDWTFAEIANILKISESTVKSRYYKGLQLLKKEWTG